MVGGSRRTVCFKESVAGKDRRQTVVVKRSYVGLHIVGVGFVCRNVLKV